MKRISSPIALLLVLFSLSSFSQCEAPELLDWQSTDEDTFVISFFSEVEANYLLDVRLDYGLFDVPTDSITTITGSTSLGLNTTEVVITEDMIPGFSPVIEALYYTVYLSLECDENQFSDSTKFYMSHLSLIQDPAIACDSLYELFAPLPDGGFDDDPYVISFTVPDNGEVVESLALFLDIGHTYNGDLSMTLTHPNGTEIQLLEFPNTYSGSWGMSVVLSDEAPDSFQDGGIALISDAGPQGFFQPLEQFSPLIGEPMAGVWTLSILDNIGSDDGMLFGVCLDLNGAFCLSSVQGNAFFDTNSNNSFDDEDAGFGYPLILNTINDEEFYGGASGAYYSCTEAGSGQLQLLNAPEYFEVDPISINIDEVEDEDGLNFNLIPQAFGTDITVDLASLEPNRPGFEANYDLEVKNMGTTCENGIDINLSFPDYVEIIDSEDPTLDFSGNSATIDLSSALCPFEEIEIEFTILLDDTVSLDTELNATISSNVSDNDMNPLNNTFTSSVIVVGSYDPNDKQVSHETIGDDFLEEGTPLKYTIRFQNTGTFYAESIVIADTIDANLDLNSLQIISTSHTMELVREGNVLYFEYDQIFLPDSTTDFEGSIGYVRYQIDPLPSFSEGETIENTAYIYFDFNEPIITNTVVTEFVNPPLSTSKELDFDLSIYPNPARDILTITWSSQAQPDRLEIYDVSGRLLHEMVIQKEVKTQLLDVKSLQQGAYLIKLSDGSFTRTVKFLKH